MSELPRRFVSRLRRYIGNRRQHKRVETRVAITLTLADPHISSNPSRRLASITGHTLDISETGVALVVPAIRIGEHYLTGADRTLLLKLELPDGPVSMSASPVRYEDLPDGGYLIGVRINSVDESDRERFNEFLRTAAS